MVIGRYRRLSAGTVQVFVYTFSCRDCLHMTRLARLTVPLFLAPPNICYGVVVRSPWCVFDESDNLDVQPFSCSFMFDCKKSAVDSIRRQFSWINVIVTPMFQPSVSRSETSIQGHLNSMSATSIDISVLAHYFWSTLFWNYHKDNKEPI